MGIYDREYYRREGPSFLGGFANRGLVCKWLIGITVVMFIIQAMTMSRLFGVVIGYGDATTKLWLDPELIMNGQVWRLLTYAFLHDFFSIFHILFNMLFLWWFGSEIEDMRGSREFLTLYLTAAIFSGTVYVLTALGDNSVALGASGAVYAIMVIYACHFPMRRILLFFVIPMPIWILVVGVVGIDLVRYLGATQNVRPGQGGIAVTAHLGGALFGFLYYKLQWRLTSIGDGIRGWLKRRKQPRLRVYREESEAKRSPVGVSAPSRPSADEGLEAKVDAVLEKVSRVGKEGLTEEEKGILLRASEVYKKRRP